MFGGGECTECSHNMEPWSCKVLREEKVAVERADGGHGGCVISVSQATAAPLPETQCHAPPYFDAVERADGELRVAQTKRLPAKTTHCMAGKPTGRPSPDARHP